MSTELPERDAVEATVALFGAVAHPVRLEVLLALGRLGPRSVSQLQALLDIEQSALSHQLKVLREARLVRADRRGKRVFYRLDDHHVAHIVEDALVHVAEQSDG